MKEDIEIKDIGKPSDQLIEIKLEDLMKLPPPYDKPGEEPELTKPKDE